MKITAAVVRQHRAPFSIETLDLEDPRDDEILVRVVASGVCHTDMIVRDGQMPTPLPVVLGHEGAGVVERVGRAVAVVARGDHVVMSYDACLHCDLCHDRNPAYCRDLFPLNFGGTRRDGTTALSSNGAKVHGNFFGQSSFGSYAICTERNVVKVPNDVPLEILGPLGCGLQTGAGAVINALRVTAGRSLAVFGSGAVGLAAVMAARVVGAATIIAVDIVSERLDLARQLGATHTVNAGSEDAMAAIAKIAPGGLDFCFDNTGTRAVQRQAVDVLRPRGVCGIVAFETPETEVTLSQLGLMVGGKTFRGIVQGDSVPQILIPQLIELHRQGRFPFDRLIRIYPLDQINRAIADSAAGKTVKAVVRMP